MNNPILTSRLTFKKIIDLIVYQTKRNINVRSKATSLSQAIIICYLLILFAALIALFVNFHYLHYVGNNYFPENFFGIGLVLALILTGSYLQFNPKHVIFLTVQEILFFYLVISSIALFTNAIQYTPFQPRDELIISLESITKLDMAQILIWTSQQPLLKKILLFAYDSLANQMAFLPLLIIFIQDRQRIRTYYFLLLSSAFIGFSIYYFFPTTAPASNLDSPLFFEDQRATGIKFHEIHTYLTPSTIRGGLIAFPSFHVIWAWCCLYLTYGYRLLFYFLLPLNCALIVSCVLLGWHYPLDLLGAALVILTSHWLHHQVKKN